MLGDRLFAINRDGSKLTPLLADNRQFCARRRVRSRRDHEFPAQDPQHILMVLDGFNGRSLFKVDLETGLGEQMERPNENVVGWWLDVDGNPVVRVDGFWRLHSPVSQGRGRQVAQVLHHAHTRDERAAGVRSRGSVRPAGQVLRACAAARQGSYRPLSIRSRERERSATRCSKIRLTTWSRRRSRATANTSSAIATALTCKSAASPTRRSTAHMKGIRRYFEESANVYIFDSSEDGNTILLYVEGPREPPGVLHLPDRKAWHRLHRHRTAGPAHDDAPARHGHQLQGARRQGTVTATSPLPPRPMRKPGCRWCSCRMAVPKSRDSLSFNSWVQYLAARGYAVFQPNFRGSDGFGRAFAESGYGEWGRKMQDDLTDGVKTLVGSGPGGSRADLHRRRVLRRLCRARGCGVHARSVQMRGVDRGYFRSRRLHQAGANAIGARDSEGYTYWLKAIGDPEQGREARLREVSPLAQSTRIKIPILLIHGNQDDIVPIAQSKSHEESARQVRTQDRTHHAARTKDIRTGRTTMQKLEP